MKKASIVIATLTFVLAYGCKNQSTYTASSPSSNDNATSVSQTNSNLTPEQLGELGAKITKNPGGAQKILSGQGLTQQSFEQQVRKVAEDPAASKRYAEAYKKASA